MSDVEIFGDDLIWYFGNYEEEAVGLEDVQFLEVFNGSYGGFLGNSSSFLISSGKIFFKVVELII